MKLITALLLGLGLSLAGCTKSSSGSMSPIQAAGCDVETAILGGASSAIATALTCTNSAQIQTDITAALGNVNICSNSTVSTATMAQLKKASGLKQLGVVGNIACPIAINTVVGFLSNTVPTTWGCSTTATAAALEAALTAACEAAVPI